MAGTNTFAISPVDAFLNEQGAAPQLGLRPAPAPVEAMPRPAIPVPPTLKPSFEAAATKYGVPVNLLMAIAEEDTGYDPKAIEAGPDGQRRRGVMGSPDLKAGNQFSPEQAIDMAARQMRQALDTGATPDDLLMQRAGGADKAQWGPKAVAYKDSVLNRARRIADELYPEPVAPQALPQPKPVDLEAEDPSFLSRVGKSLSFGYEGMTRSLDTTRTVLAGDWSPETIDKVAGNILDAQASADAMRGQRHPQEREIEAAIDRFGQSEGFLGTLAAAGDVAGTAVVNPVGLALGTAEQMANMIPTVGGAVGGAAGGAGIGAAAGSVIPGAGTAAGAAVGSLWGGRTGAGVGTAIGEFGNEIQTAVQMRLAEAGKPLTRENIAALLSDPATQAEITKQAAVKGITLGAVDAIFFGLAGKVGTLGKTARGKAGAAAGAAGVELVGEPTGEAVSQLAARGEVDKGDVAAEALYGAATSAGTAAVATGIEQGANAVRGITGSAAPAAPTPAPASPLSPPPVAPVSPPAAPVPPPTINGPLSRALAAGGPEAAAGDPNAAPLGERVVITTETGMTIEATIEAESDSGFTYRGLDGVSHEFSREDVETGLIDVQPANAPAPQSMLPQPVGSRVEIITPDGEVIAGTVSGERQGSMTVRADDGADLDISFQEIADGSVSVVAEGVADGAPPVGDIPFFDDAPQAAAQGAQGAPIDAGMPLPSDGWTQGADGEFYDAATGETFETIPEPEVQADDARPVADPLPSDDVAPTRAEGPPPIGTGDGGGVEGDAEGDVVRGESAGRADASGGEDAAGAGRADAADPALTAEPDDLVVIKDYLGQTHRVRRSDLDSDKAILRTLTKAGERKGTIHRENLDADGSKAAESFADLPLVTRPGATSDANQGFKSRDDVIAEIKKIGQNPDDFTIGPNPAWGGYVGVRKAKAEPVAEATPEPASPEPAVSPTVETPPKPVKWFGSKEKADDHIAKKKLGDTHEIVRKGMRFEVTPKAAPVVDADKPAAPDNITIEPKGVITERDAKQNPAIYGGRVGQHRVIARRENPWSVEMGYGATPEEAEADGRRKVDTIRPTAPTAEAPAKPVADAGGERWSNALTPRGREEIARLSGASASEAKRLSKTSWQHLPPKRQEKLASVMAATTDEMLDGASAPVPLAKDEHPGLVIQSLQTGKRTTIQPIGTVQPRAPTAEAPTPASTSTAPEHAAVGVDDRELSEIVGEFNAAQAGMQADGERIHHLFDAPKKGEIVRLNKKASVYHAEHGWMTPAEAKARIAEWKAHAAAQGKSRVNSDKVVLSLFDYTGAWSKPWEEAGYQVYRFDIQNDPEVGDVHNFSTEFFSDWFNDFEGQDIHAILAACPCTDFAVSGARHFAAKDEDGRTVASVKLVHQTLATIEHFRPAVWAIENPVGRIGSLGGLPPWRLSFDPNDLGEDYTKKTLLWGRFNADMPIAPAEPTEGSKMHSQYGGKSIATKNARSATPEGFAYSFFMANNAVDHPVMALANKFDRLDRGLIEKALDAGVTTEAITTAVEDHYYMDLDDAAAETAIRDLIAAPTLDAPAKPADAATTGASPATPRKEAQGESRELGGAGAEALAAAPADDVRRADGRRDAGSRAEAGGRADVPRGDAARTERPDGKRGVGDDAAGVPVPAGRDAEKPVAGERRPRSEEGTGGVEPASGVPAPERGDDYSITAADEIGEGGQRKKFRDNFAAIRQLRVLESESRKATRAEQARLAKWVGWGGLPQAFVRSDGGYSKGWEREGTELRELLTDEEYSAAEASTRNAHYTSPEIVNAMWDAMRRLGFNGGRLLEPSLGAGNFFGMMPADLRNASSLHGVELDPITGGIAKHLYPAADIAAPMGFQDYAIPDGHFDAVIGNPPFGSEKLYDPLRKDLSKFSIHNYFFAKAIDGLRPGGVMAMVVTNRMMDSGRDEARDYIDRRASLLGAIRLPNNAFAKNAGTEVTTDIIFLRKRGDGNGGGEAWGAVRDYTDKAGKTVPLNIYFHNHPEMMLGEFGAYGSMYRPDDPALVARDGQDTAALLAAAIRKLPEGVAAPVTRMPVEEAPKLPSVPRGVRVGSLFMDGDEIMVREPDSLGKVQARKAEGLGDAERARITGMIGVRDVLADLRSLQLDATSDETRLDAGRARLNAAYDAFVGQFGPINLDANKRVFRDDPTWPQIAALEEKFDKGVSAAVSRTTGEDKRKPSAQKAAIFTKRTQSPYAPPSSAKTAKDALVASLSDTGRIDLPLMERIYGQPAAAIVQELGDLVFNDPVSGWVARDEYLSGNVKAKLAAAKAAGIERNVKALEAVQPADIAAIDIAMKLGAHWTPVETMKAFLEHVSGNSRNTAHYSKALATWIIDIEPTQEARLRWGTDRASAKSVLEAAANGKTITIRDKIDENTTKVNEKETQAANDKVDLARAEWSRWVWEDDTRRETLGRLYNDTFNTDVQRVYDGSHLKLPGKVGDDIVKLRPHQMNAVWRIVQSGTTLADHVVGAGKTYTLIAAAMELRRMGRARKPVLTVPNHLVDQWATDFLKLYPGANVLAATKRDFEKDRRKALFARIATGDYDAIIVPHSSFGLVEVEPEKVSEFIEHQIRDLVSSKLALEQADGKDSRNVKRIQAQIVSAREKQKRLIDAGRKDDSLYWGELGIDALMVDEAHEFKNLEYSTGMQRVAGLGAQAGSQKATDLYVKVRTTLQSTGGRNVVFATGTPISNSMAEMFTMQRYLDYETLDAQGLAHFDAWAKMFGEVVTDWELAPSGKYKLTSRFAKFVNLPELMQRYLSFADVVNRDDINALLAKDGGGRLPVPKIKGGKPDNIVVARSSAQASYMGEPIKDADGNDTDRYPEGSLVWRSENLPKGPPQKGDDNMLKIMGDARKSALDMRLIYPDAGDHPGSKANDALDRMRALYDKWDHVKGTQLVFIDLSTPKAAKGAEADRIRQMIADAEAGDEAAQAALDKLSPDELMALESDFSVYDDMKAKLIASGVPAAEIAFIHDATTDIRKRELFARVRSGRVRFLFGSTQKMGAGMNVQERLVALHHIDAPWRPSDLEQREGRIIRQGNVLYDADPDNFEVEVLRYATKATLDARMWQTIEAKANFIEQVRKGNAGTREIEDVGSDAANAAEMKAAASGNPLVLEEMALRQRIKRLEGERYGHQSDQYRIRDSIKLAKRTIAYNEKLIATLVKDAAVEVPIKFEMTVGGVSFDKRKEAGLAILTAAAKLADSGRDTASLGRYAGFKLVIDKAGYGKNLVITVIGEGEYKVAEFPIDADPQGLTQRIVNAVAAFGDRAERLQAEVENLTKAIPTLEKGVAEWPKAAEMDEVKAAHSGVIEKLRPKKKVEPVAAPADGAETDDDAMESVAAFSDDHRFKSVKELREHLRDQPEMVLIGKLITSGRLVLVDQIGGTATASPDGTLRVRWTQGAAKDGLINIAAKALTPTTAIPVIMHEVFHAGVEPLIGSKRWTALLDRVGAILRSQEAKPAAERSPFWRDALARVDLAKVPTARRAEELAAYAIELREQAPAGLGSTIDNMLGTLKAWLLRTFGAQVGDVTPGQLAALARAALRSGWVAPTTPSGDGARDSLSAGTPPSGATTPAERAKLGEMVSNTLTQHMSKLLYLTPLRPLVEEIAKNLSGAQRFLAVKDKMDAMRNEWHAAVAGTADRWRKYASGNKKENAELMSIMHESTLMQTDPTAKFESFMKPTDWIIWRNNDPTSDLWIATDKLVQRDKERRATHRELKARYTALSAEGQALYVVVRDSYKALADEMEKANLENLEKALDTLLTKARDIHARETARINAARNMNRADKEAAQERADKTLRAARARHGWNKRARMAMLRDKFESNRLQGPYFPLARFGQFFVTVSDASGEVLSFSRFEKVSKAKAFEKAMKAEDPDYVVTLGALDDPQGSRAPVDAQFVMEVEKLMEGANAPDALKDALWQTYLTSLPDFSIRKSRIHRQGRKGYTEDAFRAFGHHMFHGAHQLARLVHGADMQRHLDEADEEVANDANPARAKLIVEELRKRAAYVMKPNGAWWSQSIATAAFVMFLAVSPAAAIVNLSQTVVIGLPIMAAYHGGVNGAGVASKELTKAMIDFTRGAGKSERSPGLTANEKDAMEQGYISGALTKTQSHDLAAVSESGLEYNSLQHKVMSRLSWTFHHAERFNREVTFLSIYRMARTKGEAHADAITTAISLMYKVHFDYQNTSRPRFMHADAAKALLVFRNYNVNMLFRLFRDTHQAFVGDKAAQKEARIQLGGITAMMALSAGVRGTWLFGIAMTIAGLFSGEGDDPEEDLKNGAIAILGPDLAGLVLDGVPGYVTGTALTNRIGMPDLWFRSPDRQLEGEDVYNYWVQEALGAGVGPLENAIRGFYMVKSGDTYRGIETVMPKAVKDLMRAYRYATEGVLTMKGEDVVSRENLSVADIFKSAIGFTPAPIAEQYENNRYMKNREQAIIKARGKLLSSFARAFKDDDAQAIAGVERDIEDYNLRNPDYPIGGDTLKSSMRSRLRSSDRMEGGVLINPRLNERIRSEAPPSIYR